MRLFLFSLFILGVGAKAQECADLEYVRAHKNEFAIYVRHTESLEAIFDQQSHYKTAGVGVLLVNDIKLLPKDPAKAAAVARLEAKLAQEIMNIVNHPNFIRNPTWASPQFTHQLPIRNYPGVEETLEQLNTLLKQPMKTSNSVLSQFAQNYYKTLAISQVAESTATVAATKTPIAPSSTGVLRSAVKVGAGALVALDLLLDLNNYLAAKGVWTPRGIEPMFIENYPETLGLFDVSTAEACVQMKRPKIKKYYARARETVESMVKDPETVKLVINSGKDNTNVGLFFDTKPMNAGLSDSAINQRR